MHASPRATRPQTQTLPSKGHYPGPAATPVPLFSLGYGWGFAGGYSLHTRSRIRARFPQRRQSVVARRRPRRAATLLPTNLPMRLYPREVLVPCSAVSTPLPNQNHLSVTSHGLVAAIADPKRRAAGSSEGDDRIPHGKVSVGPPAIRPRPESTRLAASRF